MELQRYADVETFLAAAGDFLVAREAEHNLLLGVCQTVRDTPEAYTAPPYFATVTKNGRVVAVALQTPPFQLVLSEIDDPAAIPLIADDLVGRDLPGAVGPVEHVRTFMEERTARGGPPSHLSTSERIFRLTAVTPQPPVPGRSRVAEPADRALVANWLDAFMREALEEAEPSDVEAMTDRWLARRGRTLHLWEDGEVVSLAGVGSRTPNGVSQAQLDDGRRFCFLFTDLANPTSNHIYRTIGYEPVRDVDMWRHDRP